MGKTIYEEEFNFSLDLVKKCGEVIKTAFNAEKKVSEKSSANDLVTETDQLVEKMLIEGLKERFPDSRCGQILFPIISSKFACPRFIGEESVAGGEKCELTTEKTWIIDPIDGTTNFVHSNPHICTILGFMVDKVWHLYSLLFNILSFYKQVEFGIVYNPVLDQLWTARKGAGAFYNGKKVCMTVPSTTTVCIPQIQVSSCTELSRAMLIQEMYDSSPVKLAMVFSNLQTFIPKVFPSTRSLYRIHRSQVRGVRAYGSAGINLAYLAMGAVDVYFDSGFHIWDLSLIHI